MTYRTDAEPPTQPGPSGRPDHCTCPMGDRCTCGFADMLSAIFFGDDH